MCSVNLCWLRGTPGKPEPLQSLVAVACLLQIRDTLQVLFSRQCQEAVIMMVLLRMQLMPFRLMLGGRVSGEGPDPSAVGGAHRRSRRDGPQGELWPV